MTRWGMVIDLDRCTACQACTEACRQENNVPFAGLEQPFTDQAIFWSRVFVEIEGEYPHPRARFIPRACNHCDNPPCVKACPVGATYKNPEGLVAQVYARCIGCGYCAMACPYAARYFNWCRPDWPEMLKRTRNPDVSVRPRGVVEKCTFCVQRIRRAKDKAKDEGRGVRDGEVVPACVETCPGHARYFGDLDDPESQVSRLARSRKAFRLLKELGTEPKVIYLEG